MMPTLESYLVITISIVRSHISAKYYINNNSSTVVVVRVMVAVIVTVLVTLTQILTLTVIVVIEVVVVTTLLGIPTAALFTVLVEISMLMLALVETAVISALGSQIGD